MAIIHTACSTGLGPECYMQHMPHAGLLYYHQHQIQPTCCIQHHHGDNAVLHTASGPALMPHIAQVPERDQHEACGMKAGPHTTDTAHRTGSRSQSGSQTSPVTLIWPVVLDEFDTPILNERGVIHHGFTIHRARLDKHWTSIVTMEQMV